MESTWNAYHWLVPMRGCALSNFGPIGNPIWPPGHNLEFSFARIILITVYGINLKSLSLIGTHQRMCAIEFWADRKSNMAARPPSWIFHKRIHLTLQNTHVHSGVAMLHFHLTLQNTYVHSGIAKLFTSLACLDGSSHLYLAGCEEFTFLPAGWRLYKNRYQRYVKWLSYWLGCCGCLGCSDYVHWSVSQLPLISSISDYMYVHWSVSQLPLWIRTPKIRSPKIRDT